jgi:hypothetical protein
VIASDILAKTRLIQSDVKKLAVNNGTHGVWHAMEQPGLRRTIITPLCTPGFSMVKRTFLKSSAYESPGSASCGKCRLIDQAMTLWLNGWSDRSLHTAELALSIAPADTSCACELRTRMWLAFMLTRRGEFDRVRKILDRSEDPNTGPFGPVVYHPGLSLARAHLALVAGDLDAAVALSEQVFTHAGVDDQLRNVPATLCGGPSLARP